MLDAATALTLARDAYSASTSYFDASIRKDVESDLRRFQGQHPPGSKYHSEAYRSKSRLFRPKTRSMIRKHEAVGAEAFFATRDVVNIEPQDDNDPVQQASAALHKQLLQHRLTKTIPWFLVTMGAYQDAMNVGLVCSYQHWVFDKKRKKDQPAVDLRPIENIRFDPGANWMDPVNTSPYFIDMIPMYVKDVEARMAQADPKTGEPRWKKIDRAGILAAMRGYSDSIRLTREQGRQDPKENVTAVTAYTIVWVHKNIVEHDGEDYCYYTLGDQQLLSEPVLLSDRYHHGRRPYVIGYAAIEAHKNYPGGPNRIARDLQAETNEVANLRIENVKLALNKRYLVGRNRQVDIRSLTRNVAGSATLVNDTEKDVKELEFNDVTASSYKEQEVLNLDFDEATGNFASGSVQANRSQNETAKGMELVKDDASLLSGYQLRTFVETWMEPVLRQLVLLEQAYETDEVILAIAGQKAKLDELGFNEITDELIEQELTLSVSVGMGPNNPTEKINRFLTAMRALKELLLDGTLTQYGLKFDEVCKEVFGNLGYKDGSRFFDTEGMDPQVQALQAELQKLQAALEAKFPPELIDAQVRKIDAEILAFDPKNALAKAQAVKTGVEASFSAMQGAEVIAAVPAVAPIADVIMQGAGYQLPTPAGVDPNFPQPAAGTPNSVAAAVSPPGGVGTIASGEVTGGAEGDTSPGTPMNGRTPGEGAQDGIETQESDSAGPGFRSGGLVAYEDEFGQGGVGTRKGIASGSMIQRELSGLGKPGDMAARDLAQRTVAVNNATELAKYTAKQAGAVTTDRTPPPSYGSSVFAPGTGGMASTSSIGDVARRSLLSKPLLDLGTGLFGQQDDFLGTQQAPALGFADGGLITGPGTGTSDSIPAQTQDGAPLQVSNGEFKVPPVVVQALGKDFFDELIAQYHTPVEGQAPIYQADAPMDTPLGIETGTVIIPADVVAALGADFFERLVQMYGASQ